MALTADDVLNQKFTITKFRDGYDLDQVDDFLDGIVEEFRSFEEERAGLLSQISEMTSRVQDCDSLIAAAQAETEKAASEAAELREQVQQLQAELEEAKKQAPAAEPVAPAAPTLPSSQPASFSQPQVQPVPVIPATPASDDAVKSSAMLQLALELHDKYINEGETKKAELISSGEKAVQDMLEDANKKRAVEVAAMNEQKNALQDKIDELRSFESEYRTTLRSYIEAQLRNLEGSIDTPAQSSGL